MVISLAGEWDIYRRNELRSRLEPAYHESRVVLDLTAAKFVTSTLIGALIAANKHRSQHAMAPAVLAVKSAFVRRLLTATGVEAFFPIYDTVAQAMTHGDDRPEQHAV